MTKDKLDNAAVMKLLHCRKLNNFSTKSEQVIRLETITKASKTYHNGSKS